MLQLRYSIQAYQQNSNDQAKEANGAAKDFNNEDLDKEDRVRCIRECSSRSNLQEKLFLVCDWLNM